VTLSATDSQSGVASTKYRIKPFGGSFGPWQTYSGPFTITSEGENVVEFYSTDNAGNVEPTKSITVKITTFPGTAVLDNFNRSDGALRSSWYGPEGLGGYTIRSNRVQVLGGGPIYWRGPTYGATQEAYLTMTKVDPTGADQSLLLKVQGSTPNWRNGAIVVTYEANGSQSFVRVDTYQPNNPGPFDGWRHYSTIPVVFNDGDQFGARAMADGTVRIYKNCVLIGIVDTTVSGGNGNFFVNKTGRIGIWYTNAPNARFDNFGGGVPTP
jgi:hypothetical protein